MDLDTSKIKVVESIDLSFDLIVRTSKLTKTSHYNTYQQKLYRLVKFLKEERGIGYRRISHIITEKGYRSVRTNSILKNSYIYTIYSKGKIRENRINRSFDSKIDVYSDVVSWGSNIYGADADGSWRLATAHYDGSVYGNGGTTGFGVRDSDNSWVLPVRSF